MASTTGTTVHDRADPATTRRRNALYSALIGLAALDILLQALWAGLFIHEGEDYQDNWVTVHARGADVAIALAAIAAVVAIAKLRQRTDLVVGTVVLTLLLVLEAFVGGLIGDHAELTAVHIPLGMSLMALAVWLPMRAARR
jgi:hypothetical protein